MIPKKNCTHLVSEYGSNNSSSDTPSFLLPSKSSSETTLHTHTILEDVMVSEENTKFNKYESSFHIGNSVNRQR